MLPGCDPGDCVVAVVVASQFVSIWGQFLAVAFYIFSTFFLFAPCDYHLRSTGPAERVLTKWLCVVTEQAASDLIRLLILGGFKGLSSFLTTVSVSQFALSVFCQPRFWEICLGEKKRKENICSFLETILRCYKGHGHHHLALSLSPSTIPWLITGRLAWTRPQQLLQLGWVDRTAVFSSQCWPLAFWVPVVCVCAFVSPYYFCPTRSPPSWKGYYQPRVWLWKAVIVGQDGPQVLSLSCSPARLHSWVEFTRVPWLCVCVCLCVSLLLHSCACVNRHVTSVAAFQWAPWQIHLVGTHLSHGVEIFSKGLALIGPPPRWHHQQPPRSKGSCQDLSVTHS